MRLPKIKLLTTVLVIISIISDSSGQSPDRGPKREQLRGFKKIVSIRIYSEDADSVFSYISYINNMGDVIKKEGYDKKVLISWTKYEYFNDGRLKYEEEHGQCFRYDERVKDLVGQIRDDTYNAKTYEYKDNLLLREVWTQASEDYKKSDYTVDYEYDKYKRVTKQIYTSKYTGPIVSFKPSTAIADSAYFKNKTSQYVRISSYMSDSVIIANYDDSKLLTYSIVKLSVTKKPISILNIDSLKKPIELTTMTYDKNDNLIYERNKEIDSNKINYDKMPGDEFLTTYNEKKLPILHLVKEKGKVIWATEIKYE